MPVNNLDPSPLSLRQHSTDSLARQLLLLPLPILLRKRTTLLPTRTNHQFTNSPPPLSLLRGPGCLRRSRFRPTACRQILFRLRAMAPFRFLECRCCTPANFRVALYRIMRDTLPDPLALQRGNELASCFPSWT